MKRIKLNGIEAAWREKEGAGTLWVDGNDVVYTQQRLAVKWPCKTHKEALKMVTVFRAACKYPQSRNTVRDTA